MASVKASASFAAQELGYDQLKELQMKVIIAGMDVFAVLPTGYGKSWCYACLSTLYDHLHHLEDLHKSIVIVVTPLIAIMEDQYFSYIVNTVNKLLHVLGTS